MRRKTSNRSFKFLAAYAALCLTAAGAPRAQSEDLFADRVQPILKERCFGCHGETERASGLDLRTREAMMRGGSRGPALIPGDARRSLLWQSVQVSGELKMPPDAKARLSPEETEAIRHWIDSGALWGKPATVGREKWAYKPEDVWAFQPIKRPVLPAARSRNPIDSFLLEKMRAKGVTPAPEADRVTLIRRASFDLIGLPPAPEEVDRFRRDSSPDAFHKVVERLLASPRYGERWGRHWLDVARYADSDGYSNDYERPNAWRYRDYVIRSFNQDKRYDRFILEQIAGDQLDPANPENLIATGFLRMGPWEHTGMSVAAVTRQLFLDDVTHNTAAAFLGLTMGCARCHDHKFDPIPTRDYYRLQAVFADTMFDQRSAPFSPVENLTGFAEGKARLDGLIRRTEKKIEEFREKVRQSLVKKHAVKSAAELPAETLREGLRSKEGLTQEEHEHEKAYTKRLELYKRSLERYNALAYSVTSTKQDKAPQPETFILIGGNLRSAGEKVEPGFPDLLKKGETPALLRPEVPPRLALARWIASPANPLTARVIVNRIWHYHFGKGLVATPNNFGKMGKRPAHPELLDWLASYFMDHGWSINAMHRLIMLSSAYQRASTHPAAAEVSALDPENQLFAFFEPRRLEAEALRDSMLAVSGELSPDAGGPGTFPEINEDVANQPRHIMGTIGPAYQPSPVRRDRNRRTIYTFQKRSLLDPMVEVYNGPSLDESCERRQATTVPTQVFALFNSRFAYDMALAFGARLANLSADPRAQIDHAFRLAYNRVPSEPERARLLQHLKQMADHHRRFPPPARQRRQALVRSITSELTGRRFDLAEEDDPVEYEENLQPHQVGAEVRALADVALVLFNSNEFIYVY